MPDISRTLSSRWHKRYWIADTAAIARFADNRPIVVITGASSGIGKAIAYRFAALGNDLLLIGRNGERLAAVATDLGQHSTSKIATLVVDLASPTSIQQIDKALDAIDGYADILVNCAGMGFAGMFENQPADDLDALIALNIAALSRLCRHVLPGQLVRGRGGVINLASLGAYVPGPGQAAYYASKAFVLSLSEALAAETVGRGVHVMAVVPGPVDTPFHATMGAGYALYRSLLPSLDADHVARSTIRSFRRRQRVVIPGLFEAGLSLALRIMPHRLSTPLVLALLRPRGDGV